MMNWQQFWQGQGKQSHPLEQVGRRGGQLTQEDTFLKNYATHIAGQISLNADDVLLDVCCGNGLLTQYFAPYCKEVVGVDFSEQHIAYAKQHFETDNLNFYCGNALELYRVAGLKEHTFTKATLCFSFQYFESVQLGLLALEQLCNLLPANGLIYLSDIPDREKWFIYYDTPVKMLRLLKQMLLQQNNMGKFWSEEELAIISQKCNATGTKITQPETFPYAHYRMDYLIRK
ncbi:MAG: class I SAM-dependent methyltransferase [Bacteroidota bacterium]